MYNFRHLTFQLLHIIIEEFYYILNCYKLIETRFSDTQIIIFYNTSITLQLFNSVKLIYYFKLETTKLIKFWIYKRLHYTFYTYKYDEGLDLIKYIMPKCMQTSMRI